MTRGEGFFTRISRRHLLSENDQLKTFLVFHTELQLARQYNKTHTVSSIRFSFVPVQLLIRTSNTLFKTTIRFPFVCYSRIFYFAKNVRNASAQCSNSNQKSFYIFFSSNKGCRLCVPGCNSHPCAVGQTFVLHKFVEHSNLRKKMIRLVTDVF